MNKDIVFISDFFANEVSGGAERCNQEFIDWALHHHRSAIRTMKSVNVTSSFLKSHKERFHFLVSNFVQLSEEAIFYLIENCEYSILEHDFKCFRTRNPYFYKEFLAPKNHIVNEKFYSKASRVFTQSSLQEEILIKNLLLENTVNLGGNLWSENELKFIESLNESITDKNDCYAIMDSRNEIKGTAQTTQYCLQHDLEFKLIPESLPKEFLTSIAECKTLAFFPKVVESLSRIVVEAKMLNCSVLTKPQLIGAYSEPWIELRGFELIEEMRKVGKEYKERILMEIDSI